MYPLRFSSIQEYLSIYRPSRKLPVLRSCWKDGLKLIIIIFMYSKNHEPLYKKREERGGGGGR